VSDSVSTWVKLWVSGDCCMKRQVGSVHWTWASFMSCHTHVMQLQETAK